MKAAGFDFTAEIFSKVNNYSNFFLISMAILVSLLPGIHWKELEGLAALKPREEDTETW